MPGQNVSKACCTPQQDSWKTWLRLSVKPWRWMEGSPRPTGLPATTPPLWSRLGDSAGSRAGYAPRSDRSWHGIFFFFVGFAELMLGRTHEAIVLLQKSLERNRTYGSPQLSAMAALSLTGRHDGAGNHGTVIPPAISRISRKRLRAALAVALGFPGLSRPDLPLVRRHPGAEFSTLTTP